ncbi:MAG: hypothetical protein ACFCUQ_13385 [Kiloniellales bacterium]
MMDGTALAKLVGELLIAIQLLTGHPLPEREPLVAFVPHAVLEQQACGRPCEVYGWFPPGDTIYLDERLDPLEDVHARSILVHELVHFLQQEEGTYALPASCRAWVEREREAFDVQMRWLAQQDANGYSRARIAHMPLRYVCDE